MNEDEKAAAQMLRDMPMPQLLNVIMSTVVDGFRLVRAMEVNEATRVLLQAELERRKAQAADVPGAVADALERLGKVAP